MEAIPGGSPTSVERSERTRLLARIRKAEALKASFAVRRVVLFAHWLTRHGLCRIPMLTWPWPARPGIATCSGKMAQELADVRPAVISRDNAWALDEFRRFRHLVLGHRTSNPEPRTMNHEP